jgi:hypothetical protein
VPGVGIAGAGRGRAVVAALVAGWVVIAGGTAGAVVAFGRGGSSAQGSGDELVGRGAVSAAPSGGASVSGSSAYVSPTPGPSGSSSSAGSSSSSPSPTPTSAPTPSSTVTGKVANGVHTGDVRFFLLPVPSDASVIGAVDGDPVTNKTVAAWYGNSAQVLKQLDQLRFQGGATRRYQTGDGKYHVLVRLLRFGGADAAKAWAGGDRPNADWKPFAVPGYPDEKAYDIAMDPALGEARLRAVGFRGDVFFEVNVFGQPPVDHAVLFDRVRKQITRLDTGS